MFLLPTDMLISRELNDEVECVSVCAYARAGVRATLCLKYPGLTQVKLFKLSVIFRGSYQVLQVKMIESQYTSLLLPVISSLILYTVITLPQKMKHYLLTPWSRVLLEKPPGFAANQEIPRILWNPQSSLPYSQAPATCPYPQPTPTCPHNLFSLPQDPS